MIDFLVSVGLPLMTEVLKAAAIAAIGYGVHVVHKKTGLQISQEVERMAKDAAKMAVYAVEEMAARQLKETGEKWSSSKKHGEAISRILKTVPQIHPGRAEELVTWAVGETLGLGATRALGESGSASYPVSACLEATCDPGDKN